MLYSVRKETKVGAAGILSAALLLGGCGGVDLGNSSSPVSASSEPAPVVVDGGAVKGVISQAQITAWSLEQPPGADSIEPGAKVSKTVMTDNQGRFRLPLDNGVDGWIMIELTAGNGTRMTCDVMPTCHTGNGKTIDFGKSFSVGSDFRLRAAINLDTGNQVYLTPLSSLAVASAEHMQKGLTGGNLQSAYNNIESSFGLNAGTLQLAPPNLVRLNGFKGSTDAVQLAVINAAFLSLVDGKKWGSIEQVLKASEDLVRRDGALPLTNSDNSPGIRNLVVEAEDQSVEIGLQANITDQSSLSALVTVAERNIAITHRIDSGQHNTGANQVADNSGTGGSDYAGSNGNGSGGFGGTSGNNGNGSGHAGDDESGKLVNIGGGNKTPGFDPVATDAARLSWDAPLTRANGDSISLAELDKYKIVYGRDADQLTKEAFVSSEGAATHQYTVLNLDSGEWYFAIRVIDTDGLTSTLSDVVSKSI